MTATRNRRAVVIDAASIIHAALTAKAAPIADPIPELLLLEDALGVEAHDCRLCGVSTCVCRACSTRRGLCWRCHELQRSDARATVYPEANRSAEQLTLAASTPNACSWRLASQAARAVGLATAAPADPR
jgi:hypothetical protein